MLRQARASERQCSRRAPQLRPPRPRGTQADPIADGDCWCRMGDHSSQGNKYRIQLPRPEQSDSGEDVDERRQRISERRPGSGTPVSAEQRMAVPRAGCDRLRDAADRKPVRARQRPVWQQHATQYPEEPRLRSGCRLDAEQRAEGELDPGFYEFFKDELVTQATPANTPNSSFTFNAPRSEHRGVELAADWKFYPGWRLMAAYTYLDQFYTEYTEKPTNGPTFSFNRAGNNSPGISPNELTARLGYDQMSGPLAGLGAFVEVQWKDSFYMDNANLLRAPGYELVNLNVHYKTNLASDYLRSLSLYLDVRNLFDRTYVASANNIANSVTALGVQNPASVLANTTGSIYARSPRAFVAGMKVAFK